MTTADTTSRTTAALETARRQLAELVQEHDQYDTNLARLCQEGSAKQIGDYLARRESLPGHLWGGAVVVARCELAAYNAELEAVSAERTAALADKNRVRAARNETFMSLGGLSSSIAPTHPELVKHETGMIAAGQRWLAAQTRASELDSLIGQAQRHLDMLINSGPPGTPPKQHGPGFIGAVVLPGVGV